MTEIRMCGYLDEEHFRHKSVIASAKALQKKQFLVCFKQSRERYENREKLPVQIYRSYSLSQRL